MSHHMDARTNREIIYRETWYLRYTLSVPRFIRKLTVDGAFVFGRFGLVGRDGGGDGGGDEHESDQHLGKKCKKINK